MYMLKSTHERLLEIEKNYNTDVPGHYRTQIESQKIK